MPERAITMPTAPLLTEEIKDTFVCVLKLTSLTKTVRGMMANALITRTDPITLVTFTSSGSLKKTLMEGEARKSRK